MTPLLQPCYLFNDLVCIQEGIGYVHANPLDLSIITHIPVKCMLMIINQRVGSTTVD